MQCLPDSLLGKKYYLPTEQGLEVKYKEKLEKSHSQRITNDKIN